MGVLPSIEIKSCYISVKLVPWQVVEVIRQSELTCLTHNAEITTDLISAAFLTQHVAFICSQNDPPSCKTDFTV